MKLKLLDISKYINDNHLKEVTNISIFSPGGSRFDPKGRWSEEIFGRAGSSERKNRFGYVDLKTTIINPTIYNSMLTCSPDIRNVILGKERYNIKDNVLIPDEMGLTGILFLAKNIKDIDFEKMVKKDKLDVGKFLNKNKRLLTIDKYLILPAGVRDLSATKPAAKQFTSPINDLYEQLIALIGQMEFQTDDESKEVFTTFIQKITLQIYKWLQNNVKGKTGVFRGTMLKKTLDYSARIVATSDPNIPLGTIGIPWHTILTLFEPFFFNYVFKKDPILQEELKKFLEIDNYLSYDDMKTISLKITKDPDNLPITLKDLLVKCAKDISEGKQILCKRDPVVARGCYYAANIKIIENGKAAVVNSLSCNPQGLDFDGDAIAIMSVFTNEAIKEAEKLNPSKSKSAWVSPLTSNSHYYSLKLDAVSTIYAATIK